MKFQLETKKRILGFHFNFIYKKYQKKYVKATTNRTKDARYILYLEYDNMPLEYIEDELKALQEEFQIGDFYIVQSSNQGHHCYCFDKLTYQEYRNIQRRTSIDEKWMEFPVTHGTHDWVLRYTPKHGFKPKVIKVVPSIYRGRMKSLAHIKAFNIIFSQTVPIDNTDGIELLHTAGYYI